MKVTRARTVVFVLAAVAALLAMRGCARVFGPTTNAETIVLRKQVNGLAGLLALPANEPVVAFNRALVVVDERLVQNLLLAAVPYEGTVAWGLGIVLESAEVSFDDGAAIVRFDGAAGAKSRSQEPLARIHVYANLDVVDFDPEISVLRTRLRVLAVDAESVRTPLAPIVELLIEKLGRLRIESFEGMRYDLEIPIRLGNELRLPQLGPEGDVRIEAASIPLRVAVQEVAAFHDKLWVAVHVAVVQDADSAGIGSTVELPGPPRHTHMGLHEAASTAALHTLRTGLHDSLEARISQDRDLALAVGDSAEIALALREGVITDLLGETARRYLDRVELDIASESLSVTKDGDLKVKTFLGRVNAGRWTVNLTFHRLRGILRARRPRVVVTAENRVHVEIPTVIETGYGAATIRFAWDPKGLANVVCRGFETTQEIEARVAPREYVLRGDFLLHAGTESIVADPEFPADKFPVSVEPTPQTWQRVTEALEAQDTWSRCGTVMNPSDVTDRLAELCRKGFNVKLPRTIFRTAVIPASLIKSVQVGRSRVALSIRPNALHVSPGTFWYSASFDTEIKGVVSDSDGAVAP